MIELVRKRRTASVFFVYTVIIHYIIYFYTYNIPNTVLVVTVLKKECKKLCYCVIYKFNKSINTLS